MKNKILTKSQVRGIIAGVLFILLGLVWDYFQYKTLSLGTENLIRYLNMGCRGAKNER